jgi:hypothetical protein
VIGFVFLVFVLMGVGRNLPFDGLYYYGLGLGDFLFCSLISLLLINRASGQALLRECMVLRVPIQAISYLSIVAMVSLVFNAPIYGVEEKDVFEILKYSYLAAVMVVTSYCTRVFGVVPVVGFVLGVIASGLIAFFNPMNPDVLGTPQIFNPNVIGNILSVAIIFCSFVILGGYPALGGLLAICSAGIAFFTFSKGTWLMSSLAVIACYLALFSLDNRKGDRVLQYGKYISYFLFACLLYGAYAFWDVVSLVVQVKLKATDFDASAAEGGSFSARMGLMLSAIHMFLMNPLLGVGISNFEHVNRMLEADLGSWYYNDDNPNSAWFYVLGCMGLPGFLLFGWIFYWFLARVYTISLRHRKVGFLYTGCVMLVFLIGGNVQVEMLTAYYYWVALGIVVVWSVPKKWVGVCGDV